MMNTITTHEIMMLHFAAMQIEAIADSAQQRGEGGTPCKIKVRAVKHDGEIRTPSFQTLSDVKYVCIGWPDSTEYVRYHKSDDNQELWERVG